MQCDCSCSALDFEGPEFLTVRVRTARAQHVCCECHEAIEPGERYEYAAGKWPYGFDNFCTCCGCVAVRSAYCPDGWLYGGLRETINECMGFDYVTGESQCWECSGTIPADTDTCPYCGWVEPGSEEERSRHG